MNTRLLLCCILFIAVLSTCTKEKINQPSNPKVEICDFGPLDNSSFKTRIEFEMARVGGSTKLRDLDKDGIVEENELKEIFTKANTNNDGIIDDIEAKIANLDEATTQDLNRLNKLLSEIESISDEFDNNIPVRKVRLLEKINQLKEIAIKNFNKDDDTTKRYF